MVTRRRRPLGRATLRAQRVSTIWRSTMLHRRGLGPLDDPLEVHAGEPPARDGADLGQDVEVAVAGLFVAVAVRPRLSPRRAAGWIEVVGDQVGAAGPRQIGGGAPTEPFDN